MLMSMVPDVPLIAHANRAFLRRAVRFLVAAGIRQFLDLGSGVPTAGNVHEVARQVAPDARVVYVDIDPVAVTEGRQIWPVTNRPWCCRRTRGARSGSSATRPSGRCSTSTARSGWCSRRCCISSRTPTTRTPWWRRCGMRSRRAATFGCLAHITATGQPQVAAKVAAADQQALFAIPRPPAALDGFFAGFELVAPGLVPAERWRPDPSADPVSGPLSGPVPDPLAGTGPAGELSCLYAGVGRRT